MTLKEFFEAKRELLIAIGDIIAYIFTGDRGTSYDPVEIPPEVVMEPINPIPPNNYLNTFCLAIQSHEGWFLGSRSQKNHNPGNCRYSSVGYLPIYEPVGKDAQNFAVFKDYATGFLYLKNLVKSKIHTHPMWTFYQFFANYAPSSDGNNSQRYAEVVAEACGVPPIQIISTLF